MKTKLKLGIIGAGAVVREIYQHLYFHSHYSDLLEICAVADPNDQYRNWFADLAGVPASRRFANYKDLLAQVELDAVNWQPGWQLFSICLSLISARCAGTYSVFPAPFRGLKRPG